MAEFVETIRLTTSADNEKRPAAEKRFGELKASQPGQTVVGLFGIIEEKSLEQPLREQAAVLLRQCINLAREDNSLWNQLGAAQADVKAKALQVLQTEAVPQVRRKVADIVQSIGNQIIDIPEKERPGAIAVWPELMTTLFGIICDGSKDAGLRADCIWAVKEMVASIWQVLVAGGSQSVQVFKTTFADASETVRANGASLFIEFYEHAESRQDRANFAPLAGEAIAVIQQLAESADSKQLCTVLQSMQSGTEAAELFKDHLASTVLPVMSVIAKSHKDDEARRYALEVLITLSEGKPKAMAKVPNYLREVFLVATHFIMELDDDVEGWAGQDDEEAEDEEHFKYGKDAINRVAGFMQKADQFDKALEALKPIIAELFGSGGWKQTVAAMSIVAMIAEYIDDQATLLQLLDAVRQQLGAAHPRVRYMAWSAVIQFATDRTEICDDAVCSQLLPTFLQGLDDQTPRVCLKSMEAFHHYAENVERENLEPFVEGLMTKVGSKLQSGSTALQKSAITFIAVMAGQIGDSFAPFYPQLMPVLKQIIGRTIHQVEERALLGKCFECMSLMAKSVGREGFRADAQEIMSAMMTATSAPGLPNNDPVKEYMMAASERICQTMKADFLPFVGPLLPFVLQKLAVTPKNIGVQGAADLADGAAVNLMLINSAGGKTTQVLAISTSEMDDLKNAVDCLHTFAHTLKKDGFAQFVPQSAQALLPIFDFDMSEEIRALAFETWAELCAACKEAGNAEVLSQLIMEFMKRVLPKFQEQQKDVEAFKTRADGMYFCLHAAGPGVLSPEMVTEIANSAMNIFGESMKRRDEEAADAQAKKAGDEDAEDGDEDEEELRQAILRVPGAIMEHHPDIFVAQVLPNYLQLVSKMIAQGGSTEDRKLALFVACDLLEHLGTRITAHWPSFLPIAMQDLANPDAELRQPACYCVIWAAKDPAFAPMAGEVANKLAELIVSTRALSKKKSSQPDQSCADNALSALVSLLEHQQPALAASEPQLWKAWLGGLPCQVDDDEGHRNHKALVRLVQQEKKELLGEGAGNFPAILKVLVDVYDTDMAEDETTAAIGQLVKALGQGKLEGMAGSLSEKEKKKLLRIFKA